jgi:hypothetical protein
MKRIIIILSIVCVCVSFQQKNDDKRTRFFPKEELKVADMPKNNDLWMFILAGQSNMAGRGLVEPDDTIPSERIFTINKEGEIIIAKEPLHFYEPRLTGLDCGISFGRKLIKHVPDNISILIIPAAVGGSSISQWLGDSIHRNVSLLTNFQEKVEIGKVNGQIKGILWHQGESDAKEDIIPLYKERMAQLFEKFREITDKPELPVLVGTLPAFPKNYYNKMKINEQIKLYTLSDNNTFLVDTSGLDHKGDKVHFNSKSLRILGKRFAEKYIKEELYHK